MSIRTSASNLAQALKDLTFQWQQTQLSWNDQKSREFSDRYLDPLPGQAARAVAAIEELDSLLRQIKEACE